MDRPGSYPYVPYWVIPTGMAEWPSRIALVDSFLLVCWLVCRLLVYGSEKEKVS